MHARLRSPALMLVLLLPGLAGLSAPPGSAGSPTERHIEWRYVDGQVAWAAVDVNDAGVQGGAPGNAQFGALLQPGERHVGVAFSDLTGPVGAGWVLFALDDGAIVHSEGGPVCNEAAFDFPPDAWSHGYEHWGFVVWVPGLLQPLPPECPAGTTRPVAGSVDVWIA